MRKKGQTPGIILTRGVEPSQNRRQELRRIRTGGEKFTRKRKHRRDVVKRKKKRQERTEREAKRPSTTMGETVAELGGDHQTGAKRGRMLQLPVRR